MSTHSDSHSDHHSDSEDVGPQTAPTVQFEHRTPSDYQTKPRTRQVKHKGNARIPAASRDSSAQAQYSPIHLDRNDDGAGEGSDGVYTGDTFVPSQSEDKKSLWRSTVRRPIITAQMKGVSDAWRTELENAFAEPLRLWEKEKRDYFCSWMRDQAGRLKRGEPLARPPLLGAPPPGHAHQYRSIGIRSALIHGTDKASWDAGRPVWTRRQF
ncbi:hypothetical protein JCM10207_008662 [Rhodosporidiobolus poonsookiae]